MAFTNLEELKAAVEDRRQAVLTLEVDLGGTYSEEHEQAKEDLAKAEGMALLLQQNGGNFMGGESQIDRLKLRVAETRPETPAIWVQFKKLPLGEWRAITKQMSLDQFEQYERVLPGVFIGVFGEDPAPAEEDKPEGWVKPEPLTTDARSVSSRSEEECLLPGGSLASVVQNFMVWQNAGGDVTIRPTKSGRD